jgi:hypothetical protein
MENTYKIIARYAGNVVFNRKTLFLFVLRQGGCPGVRCE